MVNDFPVGRDGRKIDAIGVRAIVQDPNAACAGNGILPDKIGLAVSQKIGCTRNMPLCRDRRKKETERIKPVAEDPDSALAGDAILQNQVSLAITNNGTKPLNGWTVRWRFAGGQTIAQLWNGTASQSGSRVTVTNPSWNAVIPPGGTVTDVGFIGRWDNVTNASPPWITLNNARCART